MTRISIRALEWDNRYAAVFRCFRKKDKKEKKDKKDKPAVMVAVELLVADKTDIEDDPNLQRVLRRLQRDFILRRIYRHANNPRSRLLIFRPYPKGQENEGEKRLKKLLKAEDKDEVRERALELAKSYIATKDVREGVLIFLLSKGRLDNKVKESCVFVFKCDFEEISQITREEIFRKIKEAIVEQAKKGALYPYFERGEFDFTTVRVFDALGETGYWLDFLELGERKLGYESPQKAVVDQLSTEHAQILRKYAEQFRSLDPVRSLADEERLIEPDDRLSASLVKALNKAVIDRAGEQRIALRLDEVRIRAPLNEYGRTWIVAEEGDQRYMLVKGSTLESHSRVLTPIDLADFVSFKEAAAELDISLA